MEKISSECGLRTCMGVPGFDHVRTVRARAVWNEAETMARPGMHGCIFGKRGEC